MTTIIGQGVVVFTKGKGKVSTRQDPAPTGFTLGTLLEGQKFNVSAQQAQAGAPNNLWLQIADGPEAGRWTGQEVDGVHYCDFIPANDPPPVVIDPGAPVKAVVTTADGSVYFASTFTKLP